MLHFSNLNYWAILVVTLINMFVGAFWYSPAGFQKQWSKLTGLDMMAMKKRDANIGIGITAVSALVQSFILAVIVHSLGIMTATRGFELGLLLWIGFTAATTVSDTVYSRRGWKLWTLNSSFYLLVMVVNAMILATWR